MPVFFKNRNTFSFPQFTGQYKITGTPAQGYIELYTSGDLILFAARYDFFLIGGGQSGQSNYNRQGWHTGHGGNSGQSVTSRNFHNPSLISGTVVIGAGGIAPPSTAARVAGGDTSLSFGGTPIVALGATDTIGSAAGGFGYFRSKYEGESQDQTIPQNGIFAFEGDLPPFTSMRYAGGGGPGNGLGNYIYKGGLGGGGDGGSQEKFFPSSQTPYNRNIAQSGAANTGSGGGGAETYSDGYKYWRVGGSGGSGLVIIRWGY